MTHAADREKYGRRLREKLVEGATKFRESDDLEELADVREVTEVIVALEGEPMETVATVQREKRQRRGRFEERIVLERVEE